MKTPRIEEQASSMMSVLYDGLMTKHDVQDFLKYNLTQAHQAGIDEAVERIEDVLETEYQKRNPPKQDNILKNFAFDVLKAYKEALQDNK